jgi:hypothetical protein
MYEAYYGLSSKPFQLNPDPSFYFSSKQHRRAKAYLEYGLQRNEGFIVITAKLAGKTIVRAYCQPDPDRVVGGSCHHQLDALTELVGVIHVGQRLLGLKYLALEAFLEPDKPGQKH